MNNNLTLELQKSSAESEAAVAVGLNPVVRLPSKPKFGEACNGCGICCAIELCGIAEMAFPGAQAPCPALKIAPDGKRTYCELIAIEKNFRMQPMIQETLAVGHGCTMPDKNARQPNVAHKPSGD